jgi:hypothetical protein
MARVNSINALVSGLLTLAYTYEEFKDAEMMRRACIKNNPDYIARRFRQLCMEDGIDDPKWFDSERMIITRERALGAGNKTMEMAIVKFLQDLRKNLGPDAQRRIDHISVESATDDAALAEELAPVEDQKTVSNSTHDAQLATDRLMRGLPFSDKKDMVYEDYVKTWLMDMGLLIKEIVDNGGMATPNDLRGFGNMGQEIKRFLGLMGQNEGDLERVKGYEQALNDLMNHVKAFGQRLQQQMKAAAKQNGKPGMDGKVAGQVQGQIILAQTKAKLQEARSAQRMQQDQARTAQDLAQQQAKFEMEEQRKEREHKAELRRTGNEHLYDLILGLGKAPTNTVTE